MLAEYCNTWRGYILRNLQGVPNPQTFREKFVAIAYLLGIRGDFRSICGLGRSRMFWHGS
jgi:hypothetical protein